MAAASVPRDGHASSEVGQFLDELTDIKHSLSHGDATVCAAGAAKLCALCSDRATASAWLEFLATQRALGTCLDLLGRRIASAPSCAEALLRLSVGCLCVPSAVDSLDHAACRGITAGLIGLGSSAVIRAVGAGSSAGMAATGSLSPVRPGGATLASRIRRRARPGSAAGEHGAPGQPRRASVHVPARTVGDAARSSLSAHGVVLPDPPSTGVPLHTASAWPGLAMLGALCRDVDQCTAQDVLVCLLWQALCVESGQEHAAAEAMRRRWKPSTLAASAASASASPSGPDGQHCADAAASDASATTPAAVTSTTASRSISGQRRCRLARAAVAQLHVERLLLHYAQAHLLRCVDGQSDTAGARSARVLPVLLAMLDSAVFEQHDAQSALLAASCTRDAVWSVDAHGGKASVQPGTAAPVSALQVACAAALHAWQAPAHSPFHRAGVALDTQFCALKLMTSLCHNAASASRQLREQSALWWAPPAEPSTSAPPRQLTLAVATTLLALQHLQGVVGAVTSSAQAASEHPQFDTALCCCGLLTNALEHDAQLATALGSAGVHEACALLCAVLSRDPTSLVAGLAAKPSCVSALAREFGTLYGHVGLPIQAIRSAPSSATSSLSSVPAMPGLGSDEPAHGADDTVRPDVLILLGYLAVLLCHVVVRGAGPRDAVVRGIALRMPHALVQHSTCDTARVEIAALLTALKAFVNVQAALGVLRSAEAQALLMLKQDVELVCLASTQRSGHAHAVPPGAALGAAAAAGAHDLSVRVEHASAAASMPRAFSSLKRRRFGGSAPLDAGTATSGSAALGKSARHSVVLDGAALARAVVQPAPAPAQQHAGMPSAAPSGGGLHRARVGYGHRRR